MAGNPMMFGAARPVLRFLKEHPELLVRLLDRSQQNAVKADVFGHRETMGCDRQNTATGAICSG
jgi:hypothetical protein